MIRVLATWVCFLLEPENPPPPGKRRAIETESGSGLGVPTCGLVPAFAIFLELDLLVGNEATKQGVRSTAAAIIARLAIVAVAALVRIARARGGKKDSAERWTSWPSGRKTNLSPIR